MEIVHVTGVGDAVAQGASSEEARTPECGRAGFTEAVGIRGCFPMAEWNPLDAGLVGMLPANHTDLENPAVRVFHTSEEGV